MNDTDGFDSRRFGSKPEARTDRAQGSRRVRVRLLWERAEQRHVQLPRDRLAPDERRPDQLENPRATDS